jgi:hypothetical protein
MFLFDTTNLHEVMPNSAGGERRLVLCDIVTPYVMWAGTRWNARGDGFTGTMLNPKPTPNPFPTPNPNPTSNPTSNPNPNPNPDPGSTSSNVDQPPVTVAPVPRCRVVAVSTDAVAAHSCSVYVDKHWQMGRLVLAGHGYVKGFDTFPTTLVKPKPEIQRRNTLVFDSAQLGSTRRVLPGFHTLEKSAATLVQAHARLVETPRLVYAHLLRQGYATQSATAFGYHTDNESDTEIA